MWYKPVNGSNTECDISQLMHAPVFQFLWVVECLDESAAAVSSSISCVFTAVCATVLACCFEMAICDFIRRCLFEGVWCLWRSFCNMSLYFNKTVSIFHLMREGSHVNVWDFGKGTASYFLHITTTLNAYHHSVQLITILKSV